MYRVNVDPEQIQALNDGEEIVVLVRIERMTSEWILHLDYDILDNPTRVHVRSHGGAYDEEIYPPVAVGDTVTVECAECGGRGIKKVPEASLVDGHMLLDYRRGSVVECRCAGVNPASPTVRHITHREKREPPRLELVRDRPGDEWRTEDIAGYGHYWEVRLRQ